MNRAADCLLDCVFSGLGLGVQSVRDDAPDISSVAILLEERSCTATEHGKL